jgi:PAS domain S-box-containing protein
MRASAGGLDAFKKFFRAMPADSGIAFVLIPHLDPRHESLMVELMGRHTTMPVVEAADGMAVEANHFYIIPPNKHIAISDGILRLTGPVERVEELQSLNEELGTLHAILNTAVDAIITIDEQGIIQSVNPAAERMFGYRRKTKRARILIVDDHPAVREALALRISRQPDLDVCGEAADIVEALRLVGETRPDAAVVDISLKSGSGIDLVKRIKGRDDSVRILVWSMHSDALYARRALRAGALGYINKDQATDKIVEAIRCVLKGEVWLTKTIADSILQATVGNGRGSALSPMEALTDRELDVFQLIGDGVKTAQIAKRLKLSIKTVETYRDRIRQKLDLASGTELARVATEWVLENG